MEKYRWYALKVKGRQEEKIKQAIEATMEVKGLQNFLGRIHIPFQKVYKIKGSKRTVKKSYFAYLLVELNLADVKVQETLMNIENVRGFVAPTGYSKKEEPIPLSSREVENMLGTKSDNEKVSDHGEEDIKKGDHVKITGGYFENFDGIVESLDSNRKKIVVKIRVFNEYRPVEVNYNHIKK